MTNVRQHHPTASPGPTPTSTIQARTATPRRARAMGAAALTAVVLVPVAACSSDSTPAASSAAPRSTTASFEATTSGTMAPAAVNPLTGQGPVPSGPVVAVKIDDTSSSRPSRGVDKADVIYVEEVEGGMTRMVGIFTTYPTVRSVRSMRPMDAELLWSYGNLVYVATGGGGSGPRTLAASPFSRVIMDDGAAGFARDGSHPAPYNVNADLQLIASRTKGARAHNVGFTWAASDPRVAAAPADAAVSTRVGNTPMTFAWDASAKTYVRTINGRRLNTADGRPVAQPNVLVQLCDGYTDRSDIDPIGNPSRYTRTVGSGPFVLYRDGKRLTGTWKRPTAGAPTSYVDASGKALPLAPGGTFVLLARTGTPAS